MELILIKDVEGIGKSGQVLKVKDGFARNFLIPNHLALPVNSANLKKLEEEKTRKNQVEEKHKKEAEALKEKLSALSVTLPVLTQEGDKLYGSISTLDLASALRDEGFEIDKAKIVLDEPIKSLGIYEVPVKLHPEVLATVKVWIVKK